MLDKWKLLKEIVFCNQFTEADKMVAFALLDHYNSKVKKVFPTNRRITKLSGLSYRQVQRSTKKLHDMKVIKKLSKKGKNFYEPDTTWKSFPHDDVVTPTTTALSPPSKPTSLTSKLTIDSIVKNFAKQRNIHYRSVVDSGRTYKENMKVKYRKLMVHRLSSDRFVEWLKELENESTCDAALDYARLLCGK